MNKTYLVSYINLMDKIYAITINENKELSFLVSYLEGEVRKYKIPNVDIDITNKTREELIEINKNNFMKLFIEYLNDNMKNNVYKDKDELMEDIERFKNYINTNIELKDYLYFQDISEQIKVNNNIENLDEYFNNSFDGKSKNKEEKTEEEKEEKLEEAKEEAHEYIEAKNISEATLSDGTKIVASNDENEKSTTIIKLNQGEDLENVIAETKVDGDYKNTHDVITTMANKTHISANAERPDEIDKNDTLATQVAYHENKYNDRNLEAVVDSNEKNDFADNVIIDKDTGKIYEVNSINGNLYLDGASQNNFSNNTNEVTSKTDLNIDKIEVADENDIVKEFEELERLYNSYEEEMWTNKVEFLYETNHEKWEEYMAFHDEKQKELNLEKAPQKKLGPDPRAAFIDISIIALITSIIGTSTLLAILINLM